MNQLVRQLAARASKRVLRGVAEGGARVHRRALLSYLVLPLLPPRIFRDRTKYSNHGIAQDVVRVLNDLGYAVDIVNFDNTGWRPSEAYDLFVGHGGTNFEQIAGALDPKVPRVYFATGIYWKEWNRRLEQRELQIQARRGCFLSAGRKITASEEFAVIQSDIVACLGNRAATETYRAARSVVGIPNAVFPLKRRSARNKDFHAARKQLLFFAGRGNVLKGLDILLDAVKGTDVHLHVCQHLEPEFAAVFDAELRMPNVHIHGFVPMRSRRYDELVNRCAWVVSASVAEGQPGAVLECMAHGLIPIVTAANNIDLDFGGVLLPSHESEAVRETLLKAVDTAAAQCADLSARVVEATETRHTPAAFRTGFRTALCGVPSLSNSVSGVELRVR